MCRISADTGNAGNGDAVSPSQLVETYFPTATPIHRIPVTGGDTQKDDSDE